MEQDFTFQTRDGKINDETRFTSPSNRTNGTGWLSQATESGTKAAGVQPVGTSFSIRKAVATAVILLLTITCAQAQLTWNGTQSLTNGQTISQNITLTGNVTIHIPAGAKAYIDGVISSGGASYSVTKSGAGSLYLLKDNTYAGTTSVEAGALYLGNNTTTGSVAGNISVQSSTFVCFNRSNDISYS
jgi:autotransporter-associated beta strand protein